MLRPPQPFLNKGNIEAELAGVTPVEFRSLELDNHIPKLVDVKEQQVDEEVIAVDIEVDLAADESKTGAELAEGVDDALGEPVFQLSHDRIAVDGEELERERILGDLLSELAVVAFESVQEVRRGCTFTEVQLGPNLVCQHRPAPALRDVLGAVPIAQG